MIKTIWKHILNQLIPSQTNRLIKYIMIKHLITLIILTTSVFSNTDSMIKSVLIFNLTDEISEIEILNIDNKLTTFEPLNDFLINQDAYKIERWSKHATKDDKYNNINFYKVYRVFFKTEDYNQLLKIKNEFEKISYIDRVEFDYHRKAYYTPNDPQFNSQWYLEEIQSDIAWDLWNINNGELPGNQSIILASVDSGVNWQHPDLVSNVWQNLGEDADGDGHTIEYINGQWVLDPGDLNGYDDDNWDNNMSTFIDDLIGWDVSATTYGDNDPDVPNNGSWAHGTHVAGLLAATTNNNQGISSTAFNCSMMSVKCTGNNQDPGYIYNGYDGILYAAKAGYYAQGFSIINCSWGGLGYNFFEQEMINMCAEEYNALIFGAAGNDNVEQAHYPSSYHNVISVTALGQNNAWNGWATYHETVDLASPGEGIRSCVNNGNLYSSWSGTSMASPVAASVAGLMKSIHPNWNSKQLETMIIATANPIIYSVNSQNNIQGKLGSGRVDALTAITTPLFPKIELAETDLIIQNSSNQEINPGEIVELTAILYNNDAWGDAINPNLSFECSSNDINIINNNIDLDNINAGEAGINFEPFIVEFNESIIPANYECNLNFISNIESYITYSTSIPIQFEVNENPILYGDLNQDSVIDILDIIISINIIIEEIEASEYQGIAADINQDGMINVQDIILMINSILN